MGRGVNSRAGAEAEKCMRVTWYTRPIEFLLIVYGICFSFRAVEYMLIRTDQSVLGEAFLHKLIGILVLRVFIRHCSFRWRQIGFRRQGAGRQILYGLLLGGAAYTFAYSIEFLIQFLKGGHPAFQLYVAMYSAGGNEVNQRTVLFFAICLIGNLINVMMEEGIFRGLFIRLIEIRYEFIKSALFSSLLFGLWHIAAPARAFWDGEMAVSAAILYACGYVFLSGIVGFKFCLLVKTTGALWAAMADHFFNNTIINILHVMTESGTDEFQILRVAAAQALSCLIVIWLCRKSGAFASPTFRAEKKQAKQIKQIKNRKGEAL